MTAEKFEWLMNVYRKRYINELRQGDTTAGKRFEKAMSEFLTCLTEEDRCMMLLKHSDVLIKS